LLSRIKDAGNQESWREFYETYRRFVYGAARRAGLNDVEAQDVVQDTFCQVAKAMPHFHYDPEVGSFKSWLLHTTRWHVAEHFRARARELERVEPPGDSETRTEFVERIPDPRGSVLEQMYEETWKETLRDAALKRIRDQVKPKQFQAFSLYGLQGLPVSQVAKLLGMTPNQIYLAKFRVTKLVTEEVKRLEDEIG
jgi:RNA polymerase sigma-70 factor (ECF subfamily)